MTHDIKRKYSKWDKYRKTDFELSGKARNYWLKAREMPALAFRQCVCQFLIKKCLYTTTEVGAFLELDHTTVMNCLDKYDQCRNHISMKHLYDSFETIGKMETVKEAFEEFLFQKYLESDRPILATIAKMNYKNMKRLRTINEDGKYHNIIAIMGNLRYELLKLKKEVQNDN